MSVYVGARAFRLSRWSSAVAAALSPFVVSGIGIGFETTAYLWTGFGVWTQLWAMLMLPLAWGFAWQAIATGRRYAPAILFVSLTVMLHFETGYLALVPLVLFPLLQVSELGARVVRALVVAGAVLVATAWVTVPLLVSSTWASVNEILRGTPLENGYGAPQVLRWLLGGQLLDAGRLPVVTVLAGVGLVVCLARFGRDERGRALVVLLVMSLVLSFGRTTFGPLVNVIPGSTDIFMRRFMMGAQLASLLLAGIGATALGSFLARRARRYRPGPAAGTGAPVGAPGRPSRWCFWPWRHWPPPGARSSGVTGPTHGPFTTSRSPTPRRGRRSRRCYSESAGPATDGSMPVSPTTGESASRSERSRCSSTSRARTSTRSATRCERPRS